MILPEDIKQLFFETLNGEKSIQEFESWLYSEKQLENIIKSEYYFNLISLCYNDSSVKYQLKNILEVLIDRGEYETWKLLKLLKNVLKRDDELPKLLMTFYDLYCKGYSFLDNLGMCYGLNVKIPYSQADYWDELTIDQKQKLINSFYPQLELEIKKVISWLDTRKIILTGKKDQYNLYYEYIDNRM